MELPDTSVFKPSLQLILDKIVNIFVHILCADLNCSHSGEGGSNIPFVPAGHKDLETNPELGIVLVSTGEIAEIRQKPFLSLWTLIHGIKSQVHPFKPL